MTVRAPSGPFESARWAPRSASRRGALLLGLALLGCKPEPASKNPRSAVDSVLHRYATASRNGDADALAELYQPAALLLPPDAGVVAGRDSIRAFWEDGLDDDVKFTAERVVVDNGLAFAAGRYLVMGNESSPIDSGKFVLCLERDKNGVWAIAADIWNTTPSPDDTLESGEKDPRARLASALKWMAARGER